MNWLRLLISSGHFAWRAPCLIPLVDPSDANLTSCASGASAGGGKRLARVGADALDHGAQAVGALRRQMLAEAEFVEHGKRIGGQNLLRRMAGIQRQQDRDHGADD